MENDKIKVSLDNVHDYSDKYGYNDILKSYFERHEEELNSGFIEAEIDG